jgi:hypothetical protein
LIVVLRISAFLTLALGLLPAQSGSASLPTIGIIDFFGVRKASVDRLKKALGVAEGGPLPRSKAEVEDKMELVNHVVRARLEAVCCEDGKAVLYIGIEERGAPTFHYRESPEGTAKLPEEVVDAYLDFFDKLQTAIRQGDIVEDLTRGHSIMANRDAQAAQLKFLPLAEKHEAILREVLRNSEDEVERAMAAYVIAYVPKKATIINDLQYALQDPNDGVRNNAMRSLLGLTILSEKQPELGLKVSPTWFVEELNSLVWSDRNKAATALLTLTEKREAGLLEMLRERALDALIDMARWRHLSHALPGYILLGRMAGIEEARLQTAWSEGKHQPLTEEIIRELTRKKK